MTLFQNFLDKIRDILNHETKIIDKDGNEFTEVNITELKKGELIDYISELEKDKEVYKNALDNLDLIKSSFSDDLYSDAESTMLSKIIDVNEEIEKANKELHSLKDKFADAIIFNNEGKILFLLRGNETSFEPGKLGLPGGHIDKGEDPETAVKREVLEETNYKVCQCNLAGELKTDELEISYFICQLEEDNLLILDTDEHFNYKWLYLHELNEEEVIPGLKDNLEKILEPNKYAVKILKKAFELGKISEEQYLGVLQKANLHKKQESEDSAEDFEKAGKAAQLGEIREWHGQKMQKTAQGWVPVKGNKATKQEDGKVDKTKQGEEPKKEYSKKELVAHAKSASEEGLNNAVKGSDEKLRIAARQELDRREKEEKPREKEKSVEGESKERDIKENDKNEKDIHQDLFDKLQSGKFRKLNRIRQNKLIQQSEEKTIEIQKKLTQNFSDDEIDALDIYASSSYQDINKYLRDDNYKKEVTEGFIKTLDDTIKDIDSSMKKNTLEEDLIVYRAIGNEKELKNDKAYKSTSIDPYKANIFKRDGGSIISFKIPKGTNYAYIGGGEKELLLPRDFDLEKYKVK